MAVVQTAAPTLALDHIQLAIPEGAEERCRPFWQGVLAFVEIEKPKALRGRGGLWFARDGIRVHLGVEPGFTPARKAHPAFRIANLDRVAHALRCIDLIVTWDDALPGTRRLFTADPVGNRIELIEAAQ